MNNYKKIIADNCGRTVEEAKKGVEKTEEIIREFARFRKYESDGEFWEAEDSANRFVVGILAEMQDLRLNLDELLYNVELAVNESHDWED